MTVTGFTCKNGGSDSSTQAARGPIGLNIGQYAHNLIARDGRLLDVGSPLVIGGQNNTIADLDIEGATAYAPTGWTANPGTFAVEFEYDPTNATDGLRFNATGNVLERVWVSGYAGGFHGTPGAVGL